MGWSQHIAFPSIRSARPLHSILMLFLALFTFLHIHFTVIFQVLEVFFVVIHTIHYPHFHSFFKHEIVFSESFFETVVSTY